ncbi:hypothetical protein Mgra_00003587 [Meloidogyne graminicola]|uniref:PIF1/LRR1 pleckstrin homology domain-containing protein n=1 Tax=Meloidogyne graminicola TaxID=189291 RepID=A0A8S9ZUX6_9BILA|nr:hypothetical protein Mgra_00003587 [Meloidogyne graminicola]
MVTLDCTLRLENLNGKSICRETRGVLVLCHFHVQGKEDKRFLRIRMQNSVNNRQIEVFVLGKQPLVIWRDHIKQGKATIKFTGENLMLYISLAKYEKLNSFLSKIENIGETNNLTNSPSKLQSTSSSTIFLDDDRFRTKLNYPKNDGKGFPRNLQQLYINNIKLQNIDLRWFNLHSLTLLSLSDNNLGKNWTLKNWRHLDLSKNPLKILPDCFLDSLPISLNVLNLNDCSLVYLSNQLPEDLYLLPCLTKLYISAMPYLQFFPSMFFSPILCLLKGKIFNELDVSENPFLVIPSKGLCLRNELNIPKLVDLSAAVLFNNISDYCMDKDSKLFCNEILDCLPITLRNEMRNNLMRCCFCLKLFPSSLIICSPHIQSIDSISTICTGPSDKFFGMNDPTFYFISVIVFLKTSKLFNYFWRKICWWIDFRQLAQLFGHFILVLLFSIVTPAVLRPIFATSFTELRQPLEFTFKTCLIELAGVCSFPEAEFWVDEAGLRLHPYYYYNLILYDTQQNRAISLMIGNIQLRNSQQKLLANFHKSVPVFKAFPGRSIEEKL